MKKLFTALAFILCTASANAADTYKFDPNHTSIAWSANHFGFSSPSGKFTEVAGTVILDEKIPQNSSVNITIKTGSMSTGLKKFDEHLMSSDFFNVEKFPTATFISSSVTKTGNNTAKIRGNLTFLGITKTVMLEARINKIDINPITQKRTAGFSAYTTIKRSDFGITFGLPGVADLVKIIIEAEALFDLSDYVLANATNHSKLPTREIAEWKIIPAESALEFNANRENSNISGTFKKFEGKIFFDKNQLQKSSATINVDMNSLDVSFGEVASVLQGATWLAIKTFPQATFTADRFTPLNGDKSFLAHGKLTIKGKTLPASVEFTLEQYSDTAARAVGKATIRRTPYGIGDRDLKKSNGVKDEVEVKFTVNAVR